MDMVRHYHESPYQPAVECADLRQMPSNMSRTTARARNVRRSAVHVVKKKIGHFAKGVMWGKCTPDKAA
jgi:hypothetical protein